MASMIGGISSTAMQGVGTIFNSIAGIKADKKLSKLLETDPAYEISPYAKDTLGLAKTLLNARMSGAAARERNIYGTQASNLANINRNATDASQALALVAATQGQTNANFNDLALQEAQDYANKVGNLNQANAAMTAEHQAKFDDSVRRWQDQVNTVMAQYKMRRQGGSDWSQMGAGLNGMGGSFGGGSNMSARMANQI